MNLLPGPLENRWVRLEPFGPQVKESVRAAVDLDPEAWSLFASCALGARFDPWWEAAEARNAAGSWRSYAVIRRSQAQVIGMTSFMDPSLEHGRVEIGSTFLHPSARGGETNPAAKRLMLSHAFHGGARRVEIITDARNLRSQAAIRVGSNPIRVRADLAGLPAGIYIVRVTERERVALTQVVKR